MDNRTLSLAHALSLSHFHMIFNVEHHPILDTIQLKPSHVNKLKVQQMKLKEEEKKHSLTNVCSLYSLHISFNTRNLTTKNNFIYVRIYVCTDEQRKSSNSNYFRFFSFILFLFIFVKKMLYKIFYCYCCCWVFTCSARLSIRTNEQFSICIVFMFQCVAQNHPLLNLYSALFVLTMRV